CDQPLERRKSRGRAHTSCRLFDINTEKAEQFVNWCKNFLAINPKLLTGQPPNITVFLKHNI
ncbi:MAG: hypothetical protein R3194_12865, partial [Limnobacter sp.]|nr:hypothetical protein [Limnobacter sp.]